MSTCIKIFAKIIKILLTMFKILTILIVVIEFTTTERVNYG